MDKFFDKLPYDALSRFKMPQMMLIGLVLAGLILGGYWFTAHASAEEEIAALEKKKTDMEATLKRYNAEIAQQPVLMRAVSTLEGDLVEQKRQLPREQELPGLLNRVTNMGEMLGIQVAKFQLGADISKEKFYRKVPMTVQVTGGYYNTLGFFDWLQNLLHVVDIQGMVMETKPVKQAFINEKGDPDVKSFKMVETTIDAKVYAFVEEAG